MSTTTPRTLNLPVLTPPGPDAPEPFDRDSIARALLTIVRGTDAPERTPGEVRFDPHNRMLYATDASLYQVEPIGVVVPSSIEQAEAVARWCFDRRLPVLPRGGGTSLAGQCTNTAVVIDLSAQCRLVRWVDADRRACEVEPGVTIDGLNAELARRGTGLFFAPDPATVAQATVGGCIGNNAAGARSILYGRTSENVLAIDALLSTGERVWLAPGAGLRDRVARRLALGVANIVRENAALIRERYPRTIRRNAGYGLDMILHQLDRGVADEALDLTGLLCGSEGTLAMTMGAQLRLRPAPKLRTLAIVGLTAADEAIALTPAILTIGPSAVELLDEVVLEAARGNLDTRPEALAMPVAEGRAPGGVLYVEFVADDAGEQGRSEIEEKLERLRAMLPAGAGFEVRRDAAPMARAWALRKAGEPLLHNLSATKKPLSFVEDNVVPVERLGEFVRDFRAMVARHGTRAAFWAHASVGVLHIRPMLDPHDPRDLETMHAIALEAAELARRYGGVMSGEHGDGRVRGPLLETFYGPELIEAFRRVKRLFDPEHLLNPGIIVDAEDPASITRRLRVAPVGIPARVPHVETFFEYEDQEGFAGAVERCNGAGVCRKTTGGTMCPSYRGTLDERHSTRGRGNALRLAITGQLPGSPHPAPLWNDPGTIETLDLCLACKACKAECPSNVDIARLKAEYTAQRYRAAGRTPLKALLMGHVRELNRLGSLTPALADAAGRTRLGKLAARLLLGVDPRRSLPPIEKSLWRQRRKMQRASAHARPRQAGGESETNIQETSESRGVVTLVADCFTAYNEPGIGLAAVRVLEAMGWTVRLPDPGCCGRAMISTGLLPEAIRTTARTMHALLEEIDTHGSRHLLFCEPSCLSAVRDDWLELRSPVPIAERRRLAAASSAVEDFIAQDWERSPLASLEPQDLAAALRHAGVVVHGHCHQKALWGTKDMMHAVERVAPGSASLIAAGCCGMAGSFGYDARRYDLSMRIGGLDLFPAVRAAPADAIVAAPGTSCRHQIRDGCGREALHPVEVIDRAVSRVLARRGAPPEPPAEPAGITAAAAPEPGESSRAD